MVSQGKSIFIFPFNVTMTDVIYFRVGTRFGKGVRTIVSMANTGNVVFKQHLWILKLISLTPLDT